MRIDKPVFVRGAHNVYRTKNFIVQQVISLNWDNFETNTVCSRDTYYRRTCNRDREYEKYFIDKKHINGKRMPSTMYTRSYID